MKGIPSAGCPGESKCGEKCVGCVWGDLALFNILLLFLYIEVALELVDVKYQCCQFC